MFEDVISALNRIARGKRVAEDESAFSGLKHFIPRTPIRKKRPSEYNKGADKKGEKQKPKAQTQTPSVTETFPHVELPPNMKVRNVRMRKLDPKMIREFIKEHCDLIKTVPKDLVPGIERRVKRIYEGTSTPESLTRYLVDTCDLEDWQAARIVRDQMQKYEARARLESFRKAGVKKVRWVHSHECKEPRPWHVKPFPFGLNGMVFDIDDPPIIDPATGERGYPGQLINCKCHLEAVVETKSVKKPPKKVLAKV